MRAKETKEKLQHILDNVAEEIRQHGVNSLWDDEQYICDTEIWVHIDTDMVTTVEYRKSVAIPWYTDKE